MIVEFQMDAGRFVQLMRQRLVASWPGYAGSIVWQGKTSYISGIDVTDVVLVQGAQPVTRTLNAVSDNGDIEPPEVGGTTITYLPFQARVFGTLLVSTEDDMKASGTEAPPATGIPIFGADFNLSIDIETDGEVYLCARIAALPATDAISAADLQALAEKLNVCSRISLHAALGSMASYLPDVLNGGIAASADMSVVAIRFDTDAPSQSAAAGWQAFLSGQFANRLLGQDWAMFIPRELLVQPLEDEFTKHLEKKATKDKFTTIDWPDATWVPLGPIPRVRITVSGEVIDACVGIDMNVDATIGVRFTVPAPDTLRITTLISHSLSVDEEIACVVATGLLWPMFGPWTLVSNDIENVGWWSLLGVFVDWPIRLVGAIAYLKSDLPLDNLPEMSNWVEVSNTERYKDVEFSSSANVFGGSLTLTGIYGEPGGAVMIGSMTIDNPIQMALKIHHAEFSGWTPKHPCRDPFDFEATMKIVFGGDPLGPPPQVLVRIPAGNGVWGRAVDVMSDPQGQYTDAELYFVDHSSFLDSGALTITLRSLKPAFAADPYPLQVRILSSRGVRWITVPAPSIPPQPPTDKEAIIDFSMSYIAWKASHCWKFGSMLDLLGVLYPGWLIDPPPGAVISRHWFVEVAGQRAGRTLGILDQVSGAELATLPIPASGRVGAAVLVDATRTNPGAAIALSLDGAFLPEAAYHRAAGALAVPASEPRTTVAVRQTLMVRTGQIRLAVPVSDFRMDYTDGVPTLLAVTPQGLMAFTLTDGGAAAMDAVVDYAGVTGLVRRGGSIHALGLDGDLVLTAKNMARRAPAARHPAKVRLSANAAAPRSSKRRGTADGRGFVAVLTEDGVEVLDDDLREVSRIAVPGGVAVAAIGTRAVVARRNGLLSVDLGEPSRPRQLAMVAMEGVHRMGRAPVGGRRYAIWVQRSPNGAFTVLDLSDPERPEHVAVFHTVPWFVDRARLGQLHARLSPDRRTITLWRAVASGWGLEEPPHYEQMRRE